ncbi:MAG: hypothetical protein HYV09_21995 [Deltaproteobacteria bacterium]|nr:hypothetical protein [Deltaproteobacteria bacterium]
MMRFGSKRLHRRPASILALSAVGLAAVALASCSDSEDRQPALARAEQPVADASNTDILADAPYRVQTPDTVIPIEIFVADAWTRSTTLNSVRISLLKGTTWTPLYERSLGLDLSASSDTNEMWLLHVTNAYGGAIPAGTAFTPKNLIGADAAGKTLDFKVDVSASVSLRWSSSYSIRLKVRVGEAPLPHNRGLFTGWFAGDTHTHTMYSNNFAEFGLPHRAMLSGAHAIGLDWQITTDHSCDLDAPKSFPTPGFDRIGSRTERWTFCEETGKPKPACIVRSHVGWANGWLMADDDAKDAMAWAGVPFLFHTGEEVTAKTAGGVTVHTLAYRSGYVQADGSGATKFGVTVDPITATLPNMLAGLPSGAIVYGAHPTQPLPAEVGGGMWTSSDIASARSYPSFKGYEFWNLRKTAAYNAVQNSYGSGGLDPFAKWAPCASTDFECYPYFLDNQAIPFWDGILSGAVDTANPYVYGLAGSDAHGDMNFSTYFTGSTTTFDLDSTTDNALGRVRTVALAPAFTMDAILDALGAGRTVLTDGPLLTFGIDKTGDGTIDQLADGQIGSLHTVPATSNLDLHFKWQTTAEFGDVERVVMVRGTSTTGKTPGSYELLTDPESLGSCKTAPRTAGTCKVTLGHSGALSLPPAGTTYYYRAMALSGAGKFRCLTNPIWITGTDAVAPDAGPPTDAGTGDTGGADTGSTDTGSTDTGVVDTAVTDTASADTAVIDTAIADTAVTDTANADTATDDTAAVDTGSEADSGSSTLDAEAADTGADASVVADSGAAPLPLPEAPTSEADGGCGCAVVGARSDGPIAFGVIALGVVVARRRRRIVPAA